MSQEHQSVEIGQIVEFVGYAFEDSSEEALLTPGQRVRIEKKAEPDDEGNVAYNVRLVTDNGEVDGVGDQLFDDEFRVIEEEEPSVGEELIEAMEEAVIVAATEKEQKPEKVAKTKAKEETEPAKEPAIEEDSEELEDETLEHDPMIVDMLRTTNDTTKLAFGLYSEYEELYYKLGGVLYELKKNKAHIAAGYENTSVGFIKFVQDHIGPRERSCYYFINMYKKFREVELNAEDLRGIGWTKARLLTKLEGEEFVDYIEKAKTMSRDDLDEDIKALRENINKETIQKYKYKFTLYGDANTIVQQAIDHAKLQIEGEKTEERRLAKAFEYICTQYVLLDVDIPS